MRDWSEIGLGIVGAAILFVLLILLFAGITRIVDTDLHAPTQTPWIIVVTTTPYGRE